MSTVEKTWWEAQTPNACLLLTKDTLRKVSYSYAFTDRYDIETKLHQVATL